MPAFYRRAATADFVKEVVESFDNNKLADLTIHIEDSSFACDSVILRLQSDWFRKALAGRFKESGSKGLTLYSDDPEVFPSLIEFCYCFDYTERCAPIYSLQFNVKVFALAEKYLMPHLQSLARDYFVQCLKAEHEPEDFCDAVRVAYSTSRDPQKLLRFVMIDHVSEHSAAFLCHPVDDQVLAVIREVPLFAADVAQALAQEKNTAKAVLKQRMFMCPGNCGGIAELVIPASSEQYIFQFFLRGDTKHTYTGEEWQRVLKR